MLILPDKVVTSWRSSSVVRPDPTTYPNNAPSLRESYYHLESCGYEPSPYATTGEIYIWFIRVGARSDAGVTGVTQTPQHLVDNLYPSSFEIAFDSP